MKASRFYTLYILVVLLLLFAGSPALLADHYLYKQLPKNTGLPSTVSCIFTDSKGFVWIGTRSGLGRFDGYEYKKYMHHAEDEASLPGNHIYQIIEDNRHNLWILTDGGIARYDYGNNHFLPLEDAERHVAYSACQWKDSLLFAGMNIVYRYNYESNALTLQHEIKGKERFEILKLCLLPDDRLFCMSRWEGIHIIDLQTNTCTDATFGCGKEITDMFVDSRQHIWIAPYNQGLRCFLPDGTPVSSYTTHNSGLSSNIILRIAENKGRLWIGTDGGGINILDLADNRISCLKHIPKDDLYSLPTNSINYLYTDNYNNLWIGGIYNGVTNMRKVSMKTYTDASFSDNQGLSNKIVISLHREEDGSIWVGTDGGGINRFDPASEKFVHYPTTQEDKVTSICHFAPGKLLVSLFGQGIFVFDMRTGAKTPFTVIDEATTHHITKHGNSVYLYRNTPQTVLLLGDHVYIYHQQERRFAIATEEKEGAINWGTLQAISTRGESTYLFDYKRIYELDHQTWHLRTLFSCNGRMNINSVSQGPEGDLWIGSNQGLFCYVPDEGKLTAIPTRLFTEVSSVICGLKGKVWIGAENALFAYQPAENKFILYGESDGAISNEYIPRAQLATGEAGIYLGGMNGLLHIGNTQSPDIVNPPELYLSDITMNGESANGKMDNGRLSASWDSNISIRVMVKEEDIFRQRLYRYRIEGADHTTLESYRPEFYINALRPGNYRIMVSCTAKDGTWIPDRQLMALEILPPWYQTWWFVCGVSLTVLFLLFEIFRRTLRRKERKLNREMRTKEKQMYEEKVRFLINISHELRTPLTLIYAPLKRMLKTLPPENALYLPLKAIYRQSQRMKSLINMVLDLRKMEVGESKLHIYPYPFNEWIKYVLQDFISEGEAEHIHIHCQLDSRIELLSFDKEKCEIVLSNLLINALKHAPQESRITVSSTLLPDEGRVRVSVSDQGCGLQQVNMEKLFTRFYQSSNEQHGTGIGLSYSKILTEQHGGAVGAYNNPDAGATFYFELPLKREEEEIVCQPKAYLNELISEENGDFPMETSNFDISAYTVLVVDDNADMTDFLQKTLSECFKQVLTASDGEEALRMTKEHMPDIVVSDIMMPRMNGYQLCMHIKEDLSISHIPVVLLTARDDEQSRKDSYKNGADAYLEKPFEVDVLVELLRNRLKDREGVRKRYMNAGTVPVPEEITYSQVDEAFLLKLNKVIQENLENTALDISFICKEVGMSRASLYNKLKALTDMSTGEYVNKFRMEEAIKLVNSTNMTFSEIAEKVGFATSSYFSTAFKQYTGETPTQYKKRVVKKEQQA